MYPSSLRTRAISTPTREAGKATRECPAVFAFRIRVSMSAMLSVLISLVPSSSPRRLLHARDLSLRREHAKTDAADAELPHVRARPSAEVAARSEEHTSELQSRQYLVCRLLLEKKKN